MNEHEQALAEFLKDNPKAQKYQHMIDMRLNRCTSSQARLNLIYEMMLDSVFNLSDAINGTLNDKCKISEIKR